MSLQENKAPVRQFVDVVQNQHNRAALDEFFSPDFFDHGGMTDPPNREGARAFLGAFISAFPDSHFTIHQQLAAADKVMTYKTCQSTHLGWFHGLPATGKTVTFNIIDIFSIADGQLTARWLMTDLGGVMQQLCAAPGHDLRQDLRGLSDLEGLGGASLTLFDSRVLESGQTAD